MKRGDIVVATLAGGRRALRAVIEDKGATIAICTLEELTAAKVEGREPAGATLPRNQVELHSANEQIREREESR